MWEVWEVRLWHHHITLLLSLHDQVLCSLLSKTLMRVITAGIVPLSLWIVGLGVLLIRILRLDLSIRVVHMVLRRGDLRQVMVDLHIGRYRGRLAHWLGLRVPWKLSDLESRELLLPSLRMSAF